MKKKLLLFIFWMPYFLWADSLPLSLQTVAEKANIDKKFISFVIQPIGEDVPLLNYQADVPRKPASVMKLLTTYTALENLGPAYTWKTTALGTGKFKEGKLNGDLIIKGYGDPKLTIEQFWLLLKRVHSLGINEIKGDVVLDGDYFNVPTEDPNSFDGQPMRAYNANPSPLLVNFNAITLAFRVDDKQLLITSEPNLEELSVLNQVKLDGRGCGDWYDRLHFNFSNQEKPILLITGAYSKYCGSKYHSLILFKNSDFTSRLFADIWQEMGGKIDGKIRWGHTPDHAEILAELESPSVTNIIRDTNKFSNNVMARQIYLTLGAQSLGPPATLEKSHQVVTQLLKSKNLDFPELVIDNGSGLSHQAQITAQHLANLLLKAWSDSTMPEFVSSLPILGIDGTLKNRLKDSAIKGQAYLKTGTLKGVKALAGYLKNAHGKMVIIVSLMNQLTPESHPEMLEDALLEWVYHKNDK